MKQFLLVVCLQWILLNSHAQKDCVFDSNLTPTNIGMPTQLKVNEKKTVVVKVENIGTCVWNKPDVTLKVKIYKGPSGSGIQRDELEPSDPVYADEGGVGPRKWTYFRYDIEGPEYTGDYTIDFTLQVKGKPFGDKERKTIKIIK